MKSTSIINMAVKLIICIAFVLGTGSISAKTFKYPKNFYIGTSGVGTNNYIIASVWGAGLEKKSGMKVRIVPENDSGRILATMAKEIDSIFFDSSEMDAYYRGQGAYADLPKTNFYTLWFSKDVPMGFAVADNSPFQSFKDIKLYVEKGNKIKVGIFAPATGWAKRSVHGLAAFADFDVKSIKPVPFGSIRNMYFSITDGNSDIIDIGYTSSAIPELMSTPAGFRFINMPVDDTPAWNRFLDVMNTDWPAQINDWSPVKKFNGLGCTISPAVWSVKSDLDEELVYNIAKYLHQGFDEYSQASLQASRMSMKRFREYLDIAPIPIHPGTVRYLREIGQWTAKDDIWNNKAMALMQQYVEAWASAEAAAKRRKIDITPDNEKWNNLWTNTIKDIPLLKSRF